MKRTQHFPALILLAVLASFFLQGCLEDQCDETYTYTYYEPVYKTLADIRIPVVAEGPRTMENPGKLYFHQNYILVNEVEEGVHIIDNSNPAAPQRVAYLPIPGNVDISMRGHILYADNYMDLLAIDLSNIAQPQVTSRAEDVFGFYGQSNANEGVLVGYKKTEQAREYSCTEYPGKPWWERDGGMWVDENFFGAGQDFFGPQDLQQGSGAAANVQTSVAGSMSRFGFSGHHLYAIDGRYLDVYDISNLAQPNKLGEVYVGWGIETLFPHGEHLFIGAENGMYIFNNSNPAAPYEQSVFQHARACDPVFVSGDKAFVTLRDGTECEGFANQMDIVDISDLSNPYLLKSYEMHNPHGLSVTPSQKVYLCEGDGGLKVLDATDPHNVETLGDKGDFDAYDVIALSESHLMVIGKDGFYQFDASDPADIRQLSLIAVGQ